MTSDAKIGLLLGLVFIFVIAFVINGLPSLRPPISKVEATAARPDEDFSDGVSGKAGQAVDNWTQPPESQRTGGEATPIADGRAEAGGPGAGAVAQGSLQLQPQPQTATEEGVRFQLSAGGHRETDRAIHPDGARRIGALPCQHGCARTGAGTACCRRAPARGRSSAADPAGAGVRAQAGRDTHQDRNARSAASPRTWPSD